MGSSPVYVVAPPGVQRDHLTARLGDSQVTSFESVEGMGPLSHHPPGVVIVATSTAGGLDTRFSRLAQAMSGSSPAWRLIAASGPELEFRSISIERSGEQPDACEFPNANSVDSTEGGSGDATDGRAAAVVDGSTVASCDDACSDTPGATESGISTRLEDLEGVLAAVRKTRHDLNNMLTSALAEVQLLLLDEATPEVTESHEFIQEQLRAMRDVIATMTGPGS